MEVSINYAFYRCQTINAPSHYTTHSQGRMDISSFTASTTCLDKKRATVIFE